MKGRQAGRKDVDGGDALTIKSDAVFFVPSCLCLSKQGRIAMVVIHTCQAEIAGT